MSRRKRSRPSAAPEPPAAAPATIVTADASRRRWRRLLLGAVAGVLAAAGAWWISAHRVADVAPAAPVSSPPAAQPQVAAKAVARAAFVDNAQCLQCHAAETREWQGSHHAHAMAPATAQTVRGNFDDAEFRHQGVVTRFFRKGDGYFVRTEGPDGKLADFRVSYTFGVEPLQQYLIELPGGRLQPLQIAWDTTRARWFHLLPNEKAPAGDVLHWTGRYQTANTMCIGCHTTGFEKNYDAATETFASRWSEPNVSCQSCHGPGALHVEWASQRDKAGDATDGGAGTRYGLAANVRAANARQQVDTCAACHSRRAELVAAPAAGDVRLDDYLPSLLAPGLYHADGQQLGEVYVDGSFRQSRMFANGVACTNCHNAHTGKIRMAGNALCTQCHTPTANPAFASAAGNFDTPAHHFHKPGSAGAQCAGCHMPSTTYMQIQRRPDHSLRVPRPDLSVKIGTPNACNGCHADKSAQWAADRVAKWYGPKRRQETHYGEAFATARAGLPAAGEMLSQLVADTKRPAIVRASALAALRADSAEGIDQRIAATRDDEAEVRTAAADSLDAAPAVIRVNALTALLRDPVRAVRIAAARSMSSLPRDEIPIDARPAFDAALTDYIDAQNVALDMPGAHLNLAVVYQNTGRADLAEQHYRKALAIDPDFTPARLNLVQLYNAASRNADAERVLTDGLARVPGVGELQYSLGLLLAEEQRLPEAADALAKAVKLLPQRARVHYNLGLALQQLGRRREAEAELYAAERLDPRDAATIYALVMLHAQNGERSKALEWATKLQALAPNDPDVNRLLAGLRTAK